MTYNEAIETLNKRKMWTIHNVNNAKFEKDAEYNKLILITIKEISDFITTMRVLPENATILDISFLSPYATVVIGFGSEDVEEITYDNVERLCTIVFFYTDDGKLMDENRKYAYDALGYRVSNGPKFMTLFEELQLLMPYPRLYKEYVKNVAPNFIIGSNVLADLILNNKDWYNEFFGLTDAYDIMENMKMSARDNDIRFNINTSYQDKSFIKECLLELAEKLGVDLNECEDTQES